MNRTRQELNAIGDDIAALADQLADMTSDEITESVAAVETASKDPQAAHWRAILTREIRNTNERLAAHRKR
jgi:hypothetical protein